MVNLFGKFIANLSYQIIFIRTCHMNRYDITCHEFSGRLNKNITVYIRCIPVGSGNIGILVCNLAFHKGI